MSQSWVKLISTSSTSWLSPMVREINLTLQSGTDEVVLIEVPNGVIPRASGHGRHVGNVRQRRHGCFEVARVELCVGMGVELGTKPFGIGGHYALFLALCALTLRSTTSQIMAAMSGPPNAVTCLMPVGEVTLISVR